MVGATVEELELAGNPGHLYELGAVGGECHWLVALLMLFALVLIWLYILLNYAECQGTDFKLWN